jgi:hypothetical protein
MFQRVANNHCCDGKKTNAVSTFMAQTVYEKIEFRLGKRTNVQWDGWQNIAIALIDRSVSEITPHAGNACVGSFNNLRWYRPHDASPGARPKNIPS